MRAASLIESSSITVGESKRSFDQGSPGLLLKDEDMMLRVLSLFELLASGVSEGGSDSYETCRSLARICTSFENCDNLDQMELVAKYLLRNILSSSYRLSNAMVRSLKTNLGSVLGRVGSKPRAIALLLLTRFSEHGERNWSSNGVKAIDGRGNPSSPTLAPLILPSVQLRKTVRPASQSLVVSIFWGTKPKMETLSKQ